MSANFSPELYKAVMIMIVRHGEPFDSEVVSWGDSRGRTLYAAEQHMESCAPKSMTNYTEEFHWRVYDSISEDSHIGIKAFITCECGKVENVAFIVPDAGLGTILGWLLDEE